MVEQDAHNVQVAGSNTAPRTKCLHDGMVDITDLKSVAVRRPGSSPGAGTK